MNGHLFNDEGASLVEYALVLALIALVCIAAMTYFGEVIDDYSETGRSEISQSLPLNCEM